MTGHLKLHIASAVLLINAITLHANIDAFEMFAIVMMMIGPNASTICTSLHSKNLFLIRLNCHLISLR